MLLLLLFFIFFSSDDILFLRLLVVVVVIIAVTPVFRAYQSLCVCVCVRKYFRYMRRVPIESLLIQRTSLVYHLRVVLKDKPMLVFSLMKIQWSYPTTTTTTNKLTIPMQFFFLSLSVSLSLSLEHMVILLFLSFSPLPIRSDDVIMRLIFFF